MWNYIKAFHFLWAKRARFNDQTIMNVSLKPDYERINAIYQNGKFYPPFRGKEANMIKE